MRLLYASGYTEDAIVRHGVSSLETAFLEKPFTARTLDAAIDSQFPNGRRLGGGTEPNRNQVNVNSALVSLIVAGNPAAGLSKGVEVNDKNYLDRFPFLAPAHQGLFQGHGGINVPTVPNIPIP